MTNVTQWADARGSVGFGPTLTPQGSGGVPIIGSDPATQLIQTTSTAGLQSALVALLNQSLPFTFFWVGQAKYTDNWFLAGIADSGGASYSYFDVHLVNPGYVNGMVNPSGGPAGMIRHRSSKLRLYMISRNGTALTAQAGYFPSVSATIGAAANANGQIGLGTIVGTYATALHRAALVISGRVATAADITTARAWARTYHGSSSGAANLAAAEGDSITAGFHTAGADDVSWHQLMMEASPYLAWDDDNFATSGAGIGDGGGGVGGAIGARATTVDAYFTSHPATKKVLLLWAGTNDVAGGSTGANTASSIFAYVDGRKAANPSLKIGVMTMLARNAAGPGGSVTQGTMNTERGALNTALRNATNISTHGYTLIDVAADSRFSSDTSYTDTSYFEADGVHLNLSGGDPAAVAIVSPVPAGM